MIESIQQLSLYRRIKTTCEELEEARKKLESVSATDIDGVIICTERIRVLAVTLNKLLRDNNLPPETLRCLETPLTFVCWYGFFGK